MPEGITLYYDPNSVGSINAQRVMVAVPLLYMFLVTFFTYLDSLSVSVS